MGSDEIQDLYTGVLSAVSDTFWMAVSICRCNTLLPGHLIL